MSKIYPGTGKCSQVMRVFFFFLFSERENMDIVILVCIKVTSNGRQNKGEDFLPQIKSTFGYHYLILIFVSSNLFVFRTIL